MSRFLSHHLRTFGLAELYSAEAANELLDIRHQLQSILDFGGADMVRVEREDRAECCRKIRLNAWHAVTFETLAASAWFCDGGFR